jgi:molecular chaperone DnaJ
VLRLRGHGLPNLRGGRGDLLVRVVVWVPDRLSQSDKKLLEEMGHSETFKPPKPGRTLFERVKDAFAG